MLTVYKKYLTYLMAGELVILALGAGLIHDGMGWPLAAAAVIILSFVLLVFLEIRAAMLHQRLLGILYLLQRPKDFIEVFKPLSMQKKMRLNARFTVTAYLSNAYAAMGDFKTALEVLDLAPALRGRRGKEAEALLSGNRCSIYLYMGQLQQAEKELERLSSLSSSDSRRGIRAQQADTLEILRVRLNTAHGGAVQKDADLIRGRLSGKGSALYKTQLRYLLGQIYIQLGEYDFAAHYLNEAAKAGNQIWVSGQAAELLKTLPKKAKK